jgi:hypothetical protein
MTDCTGLRPARVNDGRDGEGRESMPEGGAAWGI